MRVKKFLIISLLTLLMGSTSVTTFALPPEVSLQDFNDSLNQLVQKAYDEEVAEILIELIRQDLDSGMYPGDLYWLLLSIIKE